MGKFKKRNALRRGFAVVLAMATLVGTLSPGSLLAEEVPVGMDVEDDVSVAEPEKEDGGGKESNGGDSLVRRLYVSVSDGGSVACRWGAESLLVYREGDNVLLKDSNNSIIDISEKEENGYYPVLEVEEGTVVDTEAISNKGYKIEYYRQLIDSGEEVDVDGLQESSERFENRLTLDEDAYISVSFAGEDISQEVVVGDEGDETEDNAPEDTSSEHPSEPVDVEVQPEDDNFKKNDDGTWDFSSFPVVEESSEDGVIVEGPDGVHYPVKYLDENQVFAGEARVLANTSSTYATNGNVTISRGNQDRTGGSVTNIAGFSTGGSGICITGLEKFPSGKTAAARNIPGTSASASERRLIAALLSNPNATARSVSGVDTTDSSVWSWNGSPFGTSANGGTANSGSGCSWLMAMHIVCSGISYGDWRYNPNNVSAAASQVIANLDSYISKHDEWIDNAVLTLVQFGGDYQTIARVELTIKPTKVTIKKSSSSSSIKDLSGCVVNVYDSKSKAQSALSAVNAGKTPSAGVAKLVTNSSGTLNESKSSGTTSLKTGKTYYAVEVKAPSGLARSKTIHKYKMTNGGTWTVSITDKAVGDPTGVAVYKFGKDGLVGSFVKGAVFRIDYYANGYVDGELTKRTSRWYVKTDSIGRANFKQTITWDGNKSDPIPSGGFQAGIYRMIEQEAPSGFIRTSGAIEFKATVSDEEVSFKVVSSHTSDDWKGSILDQQFEPGDAWIDTSNQPKYYGFQFRKIDLLYYRINEFNSSAYGGQTNKWSVLSHKTQGNSDWSGIEFDVYNYSGCAADKELYEIYEDTTWRGKHSVARADKPNEEYGYQEKVMTLTVDSNGIIKTNGRQLTEGYYKIVERAKKSKYYSLPEGYSKEYYISLNDNTVNSNGIYKMYDDSDGVIASNRDGLFVKDGVHGGGWSGLFVDPPKLYDFVGIKVDSSFLGSKYNGSSLLTSKTKDFGKLIWESDFGVPYGVAVGTSLTLDYSKFRVINNSDNPVIRGLREGDNPGEGEYYREIKKGEVITDLVGTDVVCVDYLRAYYNTGLNKFTHTDEKGEDVYTFSVAYDHILYHKNTGTECDEENGKFVCLISSVNETTITDFMTDEVVAKGSLPAGDYILEETAVGRGFDSDSVVRIPFSIDGSKSTVFVSPPSSTYTPNELKRGGLSLQKVNYDGTNVPMGDTSFINAEFSVKFINSYPYLESTDIAHHATNVQTGEVIKAGEEIMRIKTDENGFASTGLVLPYGTYEVSEVVPSEGMKVNEGWSARVLVDSSEIKPITREVREPGIYGGVEVRKVDKDLEDAKKSGNVTDSDGASDVQGDADLENVTFEIRNRSTHNVPRLGQKSPASVAPGEVVGRVVSRIEFDSSSRKYVYVARTGPYDLCYGRYSIEEVETNDSYQKSDNSVINFAIREDGKIETLSTSGDKITFENKVNTGKIKIQKKVKGDPESFEESGATLRGAQFDIYNRSLLRILYNGVIYEPGDKVVTIETNEQGIAETSTPLPYGTYEVQEVKAPEGLLIDTVWNNYRHTPAGYVKIRELNKTVTLDKDWEDTCRDPLAAPIEPLIKGGVQVIKRDAELGKGEALGGYEHGTMENSPHLNDIEFTIWNLSNSNELTDENIVRKIYSHWNEELNEYTAECSDLVYGTYAIAETSSNDSYKLSDETVFTFKIDTDNELVKTDVNDSPMVFEDYIVRAGLEFNKKLAVTEKSVWCPWIITNKATGERHVILTDENGECNTEFIADDATGGSKFYKHSYKTNGNDWMLDVLKENPKYSFTKEDLQKVGGTGVWFSIGENGSSAEVNDNFCALPYGDYILEELSCVTNAGYELITKEFYVRKKHDGLNVDLRSLVNEPSEINPEITTLARDYFTNDNITKPTSNVRIKDKVHVTGVRVGETYYVTGKLTDFSDEGELLKVNGRAIRAESEKIVADSGVIDFELEYELDGTTLAGKTGVFYTYLYSVSPSGNSKLVAEHEYVDEPSERVQFPYITTSARDMSTSSKVGNNFVHSIVDEVSYNNLLLGRTYTMSGTVRDKYTGSIIARGSTEFTPEEENGKVSVEFSFDRETDGETYVIFEDCQLNGQSVAEHSDIDDVEQSIYYPSVSTFATDILTNSRIGSVSGISKVRDTVDLSNLVVGEKYTIRGKLLDKETGTPILYNGEEVSSSVEFTAEYANDNQVLEFTLDTADLPGRSIVVFEELYHNDVKVASHEDVDDENQTVRYPEVKTKARDVNTGDEVGVVGETRIVDTVHCTNLIPGRNYTLSGVLMDKGTNEEFIAADGRRCVVSRQFTASGREQDVELVYVLDASNCENKNIVVFENLLAEGVVVRSHRDIEDEDQTIDFPKVRTTAIEDNTQTHVGTVTNEVTTITDTVKLENLVIGKEYKVSGILMNKDANIPFTVNGTNVTAEKEFTAESKVQSVSLVFTVKTADLAGKTLVAYEDLYHNDVKVASHTDLSDEEQSIHYPELGTSAIDTKTTDEVGVVGYTEIEDTVHLENLIVGQVYTIDGILMDKSTKEYLGKDLGKQAIRQSRSFTAESESQDIVMTYSVDSSLFEGKTSVVFENLVVNDRIVRRHENFDDQKQTIYFPKIRTRAIENNTGTHVGTVVDELTTITDTVSYTNLVPGKEYTLNGKLMNKSTGEVFQLNGEDVTATKTFVPSSPNGAVELVFTVLTKDIAEQTLVAFEDLVHNNVTVTVHADLSDEEQSVHYPEIRTTAKDNQTKDNVGTVNNTVIIDTVHLTNLVLNQEYTISGWLMDKETNQYLGKDLGKNKVVANRSFTAISATMDVEMAYVVDASLFENKTSVVFENLLVNGKVVRRHEEINDEGQTTHFPKIRTNAIEDNTETNVGTVTDEVTTITDTVTYSNLVPGKEYTLSGTLMRKDTNVPFVVDGEPVTASKTFVPETPSGSEILTFTVKTADLAGKTLVAFEDLYHNGVKVTTHSDITDEEQSIHYPELQTSAIDSQTKDEVGTVNETEIVDTVHLTNLIPGQEYTIKGRLMDVATGEYLGKDLNKDEVTQEKVFVAESETQDVKMSYEVDASLFEGKTAVVFENLYVNGKLVRRHENLQDRNQTVYFPKIRTTAIEDNTQTHVGTVTDEYTTITDTVKYTNLVVGKEYTLNGTLMDKTTGEVFYTDGNPVTATKTFIPSSPEGSVNLQFRVLTEAIAEHTLVAFEDLVHNGITVTVHTDINDEQQSIHYPELRTSAIDNRTKDEVGVVDATEIVDTVHLTNLIPGQEYSISGRLMDKGTKEYLGKDLGLSEIRQYKTFVANAETQDVKMAYTFDASLFEGKTTVVFENLVVNGKVVRRHENFEDKNQTIYFPKIRTTLVSEFGLKDTLADKTQKLVDTVPYWNLVPGKSYTIKGKLMMKDTGEPMLINGKEVTAEDTFVASEPNGERRLTFIIEDASSLENKTTVAFEELIHNNVVVTTHTKLDDYDQTVRFPKVRTAALDVKTDLDEGVAEAGAGIVDTVRYDNLEEGATYTVKGTLMSKETGEPLEIDGRVITGETTFTVPGTPDGNPKPVSGDVKVRFDLDASSLEGKTVVVFEQLYRDGVMVGHHEDIEDENQDIKYIKLRTNAIDEETGINDSDPQGVRTIIDTVKYENATIGNTYELRAVLMDKSTGEPLLVNGQTVENRVVFVAESVNGEIDVRFTLDASALEGKTVVAYERMYREDKLVALHTDIEDRDQSIYFPKLRTLAVHNDTSFDEGMYGEDIVLVDSVSYENLKQGREYIMQATLMDKGTGSEYLVDGEPVVARVKFTAGSNGSAEYTDAAVIPANGDESGSLHDSIFDNSEVFPTYWAESNDTYEIVDKDRVNGVLNVPIRFNSNGLMGKDVVVFEELFVVDKLVGHHTDIEDDGQTVGFPYIETTATDGVNGSHEQQQQKEATIKDVVEYTNLTTGKEYTVNGVLMDKGTNQPILVNGEKVKATTTFVPEEKDGAVEIVFVFDSSALAGHDLVAFEEIRREGKLVATHTDIEDAGQTVNIIDISTLAVDRKNSTHEQQANSDSGIIDTVSYTNLVAGEEYVLTGVLMNKNTGEQLFINDLPVEGSTTFTPEERNGKVTVEFTLDSKDLEGVDTVVYEQLWHNGVLVATHADIDDEGQTVGIINIRTTATDALNGTHEHQASKEAVLYDDVQYSNLVVGKEYEVKGVLMDKETGEPLLVDGKQVESSTVFTPEERNGVARVEFKFDSSGLAGKTLVVFEDLYRDGKHIATHSYIEDVQQTVEVIDIKTTATDELTGTHEQQAGKKVTITDWVTYTNLEVGKTYKVKGTLMDKSTGKPLKVNGKKITASATLVPEEGNGSINLEFSFDSSGLAGKRLVVFEDLISSGIKVATHSDIEDEGQTVNVVAVKTNAVSDKTGTHEQQVDEKTTIVDTVSYTGLTPGKKYTVKGILMNRDTGKALKVKGKKVTAEKTFRAKDTDGEVKLKFTFDSSALKGKTVVVFEDLYRNDVKIATHSNIKDKKQSVTFIDIGTVATDKSSGSHTMVLGDNVSLVDTVSYTGLTPGKKYTLKGTVKDKSNSSDVAEATATFTADKENGTATVEFTVNTNSLQGKSLVVFEKLYDSKDVEIASHEDLEDNDQTVVVPVAPATPKTGDMAWLLILGLLLLVCGVCGVVYFYRKARKGTTK